MTEVRLPRGVAAAVLPLLWSAALAAQPATLPYARLWTVTPCGGQAGTTVRVVLAGADLEDVAELRFSRPGLTARPAPDPAKPGAFLPGQFDVAIPPDAAPGLCDLRVVGRWGISNPRAFAVGALAEATEKEPNDDLPLAQVLPLETTVTGTIASPTDVDYFKIQGKAGQAVLFRCDAERIDSRLDPELRLYTAAGKRLGQARRSLGREALLTATLPEDGVFFLRLCQHAHQTGDASHHYRLTATTKLDGAAATPPQAGPRPARQFGNDLAPLNAAGALTQTGPQSRSPQQPQALTPPCEAAGVLLQPGQVDWFRIDAASAGQVLIAEGWADRLGSPLDLQFELRRAADGQLLAEFDDPSEPLLPLRFYARTDDPKARLVFPAAGAYLLGVGARDRRTAGPRCAYRLRLRPERPDFRLVAVEAQPQSPGAVQLARGSGRAIEVHVQRREGFAGAVRLRLEQPPPGVSAEPQTIPPGAAQTQFVVHAAADAPNFIGALRIVGTAEIGGKAMAHEAEAGCLVWPNPGEPAGVPAQARLADATMAAVREAPPFLLETEQELAAVAAGAAVPVSVRLNRLAPEANVPVAIVPLALPPGAVFNGNNQPLVLPPGVARGTVTVALPANLGPGRQQITLAAQAQVAFSKAPADPKAPKQPVLVTEAARPIQLEAFAAPAELKLAPAPAPPAEKK